jgi:high affinity Mn2+ porin
MKLKVCLLLWLLALVGSTFANSQEEPAETAAAGAAGDPVTMFPHSGRTRWYVAGQFNTIFQMHQSFPARYSGSNSLRQTAEAADSRVMTLYTGFQITRTTEIFLDVESSGGRGISDALGLAGFTNLDVVRNPSLGMMPYLARLLIRQTIPLSKDTVEQQRDFLHLAPQAPRRRLEFCAGKFSVVDFLDLNAAGSDSHLQFMNWTVDNNGGYDYAADTRGYTWGAMLEYDDRMWSLRFLEALMPKVANGLNFETNLHRARAENVELELRPKIAGRNSVIRLLGYANHANMGDYQRAIAEFLQGITPAPDITATRKQGTVKYGFGLNVEQEIAKQVRGFLRAGWNEGQHESFVYTEVNQTVALGTDISGAKWRRGHDRLGLAFASNGISKAHQNYLALGGLGFLLGDGALHYGRENLVEAYYTAHLWRGMFGSLDVQHINNPGYNRDRGPVWVPALRLHVDF